MPIVDGLEGEFEGRVEVTRLDANEGTNGALQQELGVQGHPSFVVVDAEGAVTERFFGPQEEATLEEAMAAVAR